MTRRVVLHVGLPKTGTTYLQALLAHHRDALRAAGVLYPFVKPQAMFLGAVEVRGSHEKFGLLPPGRRRHLAGAVRPGSRARRDVGDQPRDPRRRRARGDRQRRSRPLSGLDVDVVVTARDLGRQATAHWQEEVKLGDTRSFADFEREQFRADVPRGAQASGRTSGTRRTTPRRCAGGRPRVPAERVHLVVCPPPGAAARPAVAPVRRRRVASPAPPTASSTRRPSAPPTSR